jgi:hypothetical protein
MKGWQAVEQQTEATAAARERAQQSFLPELRVNVKNPGPYVIRFGEQGTDVNSFPVHVYNEPDGRGGFYARRFTCLTELGVPSSECPGCRGGLPRKIRGVYNLIQRQRVVLRKGADGKAVKTGTGEYIIDGHADQVVVANVGGPTAEMLRKADGNYQGLMSRDFVVQYSGDNFQAWSISPAIDSAGNAMATPLSQADLALLAAKHDLDAYMKPPTPQEAEVIVQKFGANSGANRGGGQAQQAPPAAPANPMLAGADLQGSPYNALGAVTGQQ